MTLLGSGTVVLGDRQKRFWDRVELLDGGVLRVASTARWADPDHLSTSYVAETVVEYHAPGTWISFIPEVERNGALTVVVEG